MEKILQGARHEVDGLRNMTDTVSENQMFKLQEEIRGNSADMLVQLKNNERQSTSLDVMQVIFAGSLAFELLDRLTGEWSVVHTEWGRMWIVEPLMNKVRVRLVWVCVCGGGIAAARVRARIFAAPRSRCIEGIRRAVHHSLRAWTRYDLRREASNAERSNARARHRTVRRLRETDERATMPGTSCARERRGAHSARRRARACWRAADTRCALLLPLDGLLSGSPWCGSSCPC